MLFLLGPFHTNYTHILDYFVCPLPGFIWCVAPLGAPYARGHSPGRTVQPVGVSLVFFTPPSHLASPLTHGMLRLKCDPAYHIILLSHYLMFR